MARFEKCSYMPLNWKSSIAAVAILGLGLLTACVVAFFAMGAALEKSTSARLASAAKQGMMALDDVGRRIDAYAHLLAGRHELADMLDARDQARLERTALHDFKSLRAIDPVVAAVEFTDARGIVVMRGHNPERKGDDKSKSPQVRAAIGGQNVKGLTVSKTSGEAAQDAVYPILKNGRVVGTVKVGAYFRGDMAREIKQSTGLEIVFALDGEVRATTLGEKTAVSLTQDQIAGKNAVETATFADRSFLAQFAHRPSDVGAGMTIGFLADRSVISEARRDFAATLGLVGVLVIVLVSPILVWIMTRFTQRLLSVATSIRRVAEGHLSDAIPHSAEADEIGQIAAAVSRLRDSAIEKQKLEEAAAMAEREAMAARVRAEEEAVARERSAVASAIGAEMSKLAKKDLTVRLHGLPGAYRQLETDFNLAMNELEIAIREVHHTADTVETSTSGIRKSASELSKRTEQQASSLEETAAALDQITATGRKAAEGAQHARDAVTIAAKDAQGASVIVGQAVEAMKTIEQSSCQVESIISVIDEIAFQTNLLALNAGVEAARAGESGRGFAVVASEVRGLAQRSANAAKEIKSLIAASSVHVREGAALVAQTGNALDRIAKQVVDINAVVVNIASGAEEQATGLQEVNQAVNQMDRVTQQNAAMVEETTQASQVLAQAGSELASLIAQFNLTSKRYSAAA